jgi:hypothetical protein
MKRPNLSNKNVDPTNYEVNCEVTVTSNQTIENVPIHAMILWLQSLPENAKVRYAGVSSGKVILQATWTEMRNG